MNPYLLVIAPENGEIYTGTYSEKAAPYPADPHEPINSVISEALMIFNVKNPLPRVRRGAHLNKPPVKRMLFV